ncbi:MAG TPA: glycosyltransferase [Euryarchaeota archaeon]|nr:glycosyltransferase [Euryarchaeota archaeon]
MNMLSIIIPHYNEESRIRRFHDKYFRLLDYLKSEVKDFEIILEEDGSRDNTKELLREISSKDDHFVLLTHEERLGKGGGLISAFRASKGEYIILLDADFPVPFETIGEIYKKLKEGYDVVIPSRRHPESKTDIPLLRRVFSLGYNIFVRLLFKINIRDTQIGVKGFRREVLEKCLPRYALGFSMDVEILVRAYRLGYKILEIPTRYRHGSEEHVNILRESYKMGKETIRLWKMLKHEGLI